MINKIVIGACLFLSFVSFSQEGTSSPYSYYGIGEAKFNGTLESRSMGGLSIAQDSTHINLQNPAGLANLKWTAFTIGLSSNSTTQKTTTASEKTRRSTFDYLALGIPLGKFGAAFGLMPLSSVGYKIAYDNVDGTQNSKRFDGWGDLNKVFLGVGYEITPNLNVGISGYYNFGKIQTNSLEFIPYVPIGTRELNVAIMSGFNVNVGLMYKTKINTKLSFFSGLTYSPESTMVSDNTRSIGTVSYNSNFDLQIKDPFDDMITSTNIKIPQKWSLGAGIGDNKRWLIGGEYALQDGGNLSNSYNAKGNAVYGKYEKYSVGGFFIPNPNPFSSYAKRITLRGGLKYEKTGLIVNSTSINDVGLTFGIGLPIIGSLSNFNFGLEYGKKGTTANDLIQQNYFNVNFSFSLNDRWFVKRKFY